MTRHEPSSLFRFAAAASALLAVVCFAIPSFGDHAAGAIAMGLFFAACALVLLWKRPTAYDSDARGLARADRREPRLDYDDVVDVSLHRLAGEIALATRDGRRVRLSSELEGVETIVDRALESAVAHAAERGRGERFEARIPPAWTVLVIGGALGSLPVILLRTGWGALAGAAVLTGLGLARRWVPREIVVPSGKRELALVAPMRTRALRLEGAMVAILRGPHGLCLALQSQTGHALLPIDGQPLAALVSALRREGVVLAPFAPRPSFALWARLTRDVVLGLAAPLLSVLAMAWTFALSASSPWIEVNALVRAGLGERAHRQISAYLSDHPRDRHARHVFVATLDAMQGSTSSRRERDLERAELIRLATSEDPEDRLIGLEAQGLSELAAGRLASAAEALEQSHAVDPRDAEVTRDLAEVRIAQRDDAAVRALLPAPATSEDATLRMRSALHAGTVGTLTAHDWALASPGARWNAGIATGRPGEALLALGAGARAIGLALLAALIVSAAALRALRLFDARPVALGTATGLGVGALRLLLAVDPLAMRARALVTLLALAATWLVAWLAGSRAEPGLARCRSYAAFGIAVGCASLVLPALGGASLLTALDATSHALAGLGIVAAPGIALEADRGRPQPHRKAAVLGVLALVVLALPTSSPASLVVVLVGMAFDVVRSLPRGQTPLPGVAGMAFALGLAWALPALALTPTLPSGVLSVVLLPSLVVTVMGCVVLTLPSVLSSVTAPPPA